MTEMETILKDKHSGSTVIREDANGVVIRNASGGIEKVSNAQAHNYSVTAGERSNRQHNSDMTAQAKANVQEERRLERQKKQDTIAAVGEEVRLKRERLQKENDSFSNYKV